MPSATPAEGYQADARGHRGTRAVRRLVEYAPASGSLALWMRHRDVDLPPAASRARFAEYERAGGRSGGGLARSEGGSGDARGGTDHWLIGNDGKTIWYGAAFERLSLARQTGLVAHQVLHVALRHVARERELRSVLGDVDAELFNLCADAIVDASLSHLDWLEPAPGAVLLDELLERLLGERTSVGASLLRWDTESLYRAIDDRVPARGGASRSGGRASAAGEGGDTGDGQAGHDRREADGAVGSAADGTTPENDSAPGGVGSAEPRTAAGNPEARRPDAPTPSNDTLVDGPIAAAARQLAGLRPPDLFPEDGHAPEQEASAAREWSERLARAHASDAGQSLLRELLADRARSRTPWESLLRTRLARSLAERSEPSWSRPTRSWLANRGRTADGRRLPWEPGTSGLRPAPRLCVVVDVSGSVETRTLERFAREFDRLMRVHRAEVHLIAGDERVRHRARLRPGCGTLAALAVEGGGGTDFVPLLEAAGALRPDLIVVLTDLEGPAGSAPRWPVLWAVPASAAERPVPFGRRIVID